MKQIERLESGNRNGFAVVTRDELVGPATDDRGDVARTDECIEPHVRRFENGLDGRNYRDVIAEYAEVLDAVRLRLLERQRRRRRGRFEADREEVNLEIRILFGELQGVERRVDHPHVHTARLELQRCAF